MSKFLTIVAFVSAVMLFWSPCIVAQDNDDAPNAKDKTATEDDESAARLAHMRRRAEHTKVFAVSDGKRDPIAMRENPVFRYADQPRGIVDGTLWVWGEPGRPIALQKVEYYPPTPTSWTYCLASLSSEVISTEWKGGRQWTATKPGVEMQPLDDAPEPSASKTGRLRQMKQLARRFAVHGSESTNRREHLRLMPQPIHRYADPKTGLEDGAIFGFGSGTNPNCLLLIELRAADREPPQWQFGFVGMSAESLRARFDDREVWYFPPAARIGGLDTWIWFFEAKGMEDGS